MFTGVSPGTCESQILIPAEQLLCLYPSFHWAQWCCWWNKATLWELRHPVQPLNEQLHLREESAPDSVSKAQTLHFINSFFL